LLKGFSFFVRQRSLLEAHVAAVADDNKIILTQTSCGYLEFSMNWITHAEELGIHNWLTVVEDETSLRYIDDRYPGHTVPASLFTNESLGDGNALYEIGTANFNKVACARPLYLQVWLLLLSLCMCSVHATVHE
jgi:rhamnogalacturonan II specific xylosyltransferase